MKKTYWVKSIGKLEKLHSNSESMGWDPEWRIMESPCWYMIASESAGMDVIYKTGSWDEVVDFCRKHCNSNCYGGLINGLGCTEHELAEATRQYMAEYEL